MKEMISFHKKAYFLDIFRLYYVYYLKITVFRKMKSKKHFLCFFFKKVKFTLLIEIIKLYLLLLESYLTPRV